MIEHLIGRGLIMDLGILSREQNEVLERLKKSVLSNKLFRNLFYLAGKTGLALILAHRKSDVFDFFSKEKFSTEKLLGIIIKSFGEDKVIAIIQRGTKKDFIDLWTIMKEKNTL
ncbi:hypothetical protein ES695_13065 [Candidatus Atribacteria bacterium 1244-E10-H5-B2]|nr:MAG: hypothetical protein ES695_13065 [Candidatus Atribacteria bacterium 1244-E10-H5-B2]